MAWWSLGLGKRKWFTGSGHPVWFTRGHIVLFLVGSKMEVGTKIKATVSH